MKNLEQLQGISSLLLFSILQITYASLLPELVNHNKFPFFFRSTPSVISFNEAKLAVLSHFKWRRVGIIYDYSQTLNFQVSFPFFISPLSFDSEFCESVDFV